MSAEDEGRSRDSFVLNWRYVFRQAQESFRTFTSPARNVREVEVILQAGKAAASEYVSSISEASAVLTWKLILEKILKPIFRKLLDWLKSLISGT